MCFKRSPSTFPFFKAWRFLHKLRNRYVQRQWSLAWKPVCESACLSPSFHSVISWVKLAHPCSRLRVLGSHPVSGWRTDASSGHRDWTLVSLSCYSVKSLWTCWDCYLLNPPKTGPIACHENGVKGYREAVSSEG